MTRSNHAGAASHRVRRFSTATAMALLPLAACRPAEPATNGDAGATTVPPHEHMAMDAPPATEPSGVSLYVLDETWTDQAGRSVKLDELAGRPRLIAMVYTHCTWACPRIVAEMKRIEAAVSDLDAARAPGFVLVSIDPERDTPERLAAFAREVRLDPARWTLLTGPEDQVLELSVLLGVKYRATQAGEFSHSNLVTVLDANGAVAARLEGLDTDPSGVIATVRRLSGAVEP